MVAIRVRVNGIKEGPKHSTLAPIAQFGNQTNPVQSNQYMGVSALIASSFFLTLIINAAVSAPSRILWSKDKQIFIMGRIAIASPGSTTGLFTMDSVVRMAACGGFTKGCETIEPSAPVLFNVNVPPRTSDSSKWLSLARWVRSLQAWANPLTLNLSAS